VLSKGRMIHGLFVVCFGIGGAFTPNDVETTPLGLRLVVLAVALVFPMVAIAPALQRTRPRQPTRNWNVPNWSTDPFSGPPHFFHAAAWAFIAFGLVGLLSSGVRGFLFGSMLPMMALPFGAGLLIGLHIYHLRA
jgi:hypothetical protein